VPRVHISFELRLRPLDHEQLYTYIYMYIYIHISTDIFIDICIYSDVTSASCLASTSLLSCACAHLTMSSSASLQASSKTILASESAASRPLKDAHMERISSYIKKKNEIIRMPALALFLGSALCCCGVSCMLWKIYQKKIIIIYSRSVEGGADRDNILL